MGLLTLSFARSHRVTPASNVHAHHTLDECECAQWVINVTDGRTSKQGKISRNRMEVMVKMRRVIVVMTERTENDASLWGMTL